MKKAFVTGGSRGIGRGIVEKLASDGYDVVFTYNSKKEDAEQAAAALANRYGTCCQCLQASLEKPGEGVRAFRRAVAALEGLTLMVNNAGATIFEDILDLTEDNLDYLIQLDFKNYLLLMREAARYMAAHEIQGCIVNITSTRGARAYPGDAVYGGIKAGLNRAVQSIALDLAPYGIRVNNIGPGAVRIRTAQEVEKEFAGRMPPSFWDDLGKSVPLGRSGTPADIGDAVLFLASERAAYITGVTLHVDGGLILPGMPETGGGAAAGWGASPKRKIEYEL